MAEMLINNWGGGIGDDPFNARDGECFDMENIDIRTTPRKISSDQSFLGTYSTETSAYNDTLKHVTESIDGLVQSYNSRCFIDAGDITSLVSGADMHYTVGSNFQDYHITTNPEGVRHFFFTHNNSTNPILVVGYSGGTRALIGSAINTSGSAGQPPVYLRTTAVCYLWKGAMLFARGSKIYEVNPEAPTAPSGAKIELPVGATVKYITYQGGIINIVYTINNDTYIHGCTYDGTNYRLYPYADRTAGEKAITVTSNGAIIYWVSTSGIFIYNGTSQLVKKFTFTTITICSYNKGILRIAEGTDFYEYGVNKPGYGSPLTKKTSVLPIYGVTENKILTFQAGANRWRVDILEAAYKNSEYLTHPYTAGQFGVSKKGLGIRVGYTLPRTSYVSPSIQCSIVIKIQTYDMYAINVNTFVTIGTITDNTKTSKDIMFTEISKALGDSGWSDELSWFRILIELKAGDPYSAYGNTVFRKTPEVYDLYITHEEIKQSI